MDLLPTVLDFYRIAIPAGMQGRSLLPLARGGRLPDRPVYLSLERDYKMAAMVQDPWKVLSHEDQLFALYRLDSDPAERQNLIFNGRPAFRGAPPNPAPPARIARATELLEALKAHRVRAQKQQTTPGRKVATPGEVERLKALGYVGH